MILAFELSMPSNNSWNGRWSGEGRKYVLLKTFRGKKSVARAEKIRDQGTYYYNWQDGWGARIDVTEVNTVQAAKLRKESLGFCGYDWMVTTICDYGKPMADYELREYLTAKNA